MKIGILYCQGTAPNLTHDFVYNGGAGGTETCIIQLAEYWAECGHEVHVVCPCSKTIDYGVHFIPQEHIDDFLNTNRFDFILIERFYKDVINKVKKYSSTSNIVFLHSLNAINEYSIYGNTGARGYGILPNYENDSELSDPMVKNIIALSKSHCEEYHKYNNVPYEKIKIVPNCIDERLYANMKMDRPIDHRILWSSQLSRGVSILIKYILPEVRKIIPDFGVDIAKPSYCTDIISNNIPNVNFIGTLSKKEIVEERTKHGCWWYPSTFNETFCITGVEAALCGNTPILPLLNGPATIFEPFKDDIGMKYTCADGWSFVNESVERIVDCIMNYNSLKNIELRTKMFDYMIKTYNRKAVANQIMSAAFN